MSGMIHKYRFLIRNLPKYPSRSKDKLLVVVKEEFRINRNIEEGKKLEMMKAEVDAGIKELSRYIYLDKKDNINDERDDNDDTKRHTVRFKQPDRGTNMIFGNN
ncbi:hypothetical protein DFA_00451 [Cavenderia fasciculata]|uniref:LYR motif-containing protein 7 n=1 Tax=Cavenderia fasciculata TaxID=261658 RepID=F4PRZ2_CACFS|nr:uncharacterized protein DFA_00451 [Cavenderia fasciculata]EGG20590.1 hypothetical protein DFA_00451 [Cavenderia fasciculata]|eukprot:XP_004358440.1 hypothetical protein DFA_00451 [Cavenderia fasciculata]